MTDTISLLARTELLFFVNLPNSLCKADFLVPKVSSKSYNFKRCKKCMLYKYNMFNFVIYILSSTNKQIKKKILLKCLIPFWIAYL